MVSLPGLRRVEIGLSGSVTRSAREEGLPHCALARVVHSSNKYWNMRMVFFKVPFYLLCIFALNQAHYASEGSRWMNLPLKDLQAAAEARDSAQAFWRWSTLTETKERIFRSRMQANGRPFPLKPIIGLVISPLFLARFRADGLEETDARPLLSQVLPGSRRKNDQSRPPAIR